MTLSQTVTWIPVSERLPDSERVVSLATDYGTVLEGYWVEERKTWLAFDERNSMTSRKIITHWAEPLLHPSQIKQKGDR